MPILNLKDIVTSVNKRSNADFINRLKQGSKRKTITDWQDNSKIATHKLSWATDDKGNAIVYPNVQNINNELHDFTNPIYKHGKWDAMDSAIEHGDTLMMTPIEADLFTKNYKKYYPAFNKRKTLED